MSGHPRGMMTPAMARGQLEALKGMQPEDLERMAGATSAGSGPGHASNMEEAQRAADMLKVGSRAGSLPDYDAGKLMEGRWWKRWMRVAFEGGAG